MPRLIGWPDICIFVVHSIEPSKSRHPYGHQHPPTLRAPIAIRSGSAGGHGRAAL